jgi:hypothetical protein
MDRQARTGDRVLVKSREMTGMNQTLPWWLGGEGVKTTEIKIHIGPVGDLPPDLHMEENPGKNTNPCSINAVAKKLLRVYCR